MFENDADMESEIVAYIKNLPSRENCSFKCEFYYYYYYYYYYYFYSFKKK